MTDFKGKFEKNIRAKLQEELGVKSHMGLPRIKKIVVNSSSRNILGNKKTLEKVLEELGLITGQRPKVTKARISIATFKLREGDNIGVAVTLRGKRMYDFLEKLITVVFPRVRDFSGIDLKSFDGRGNISIGFNEHTVFPEIDPGKIDAVRSLEIAIVTNAGNDKASEALLRAMGMPFKKDKNQKI